MKLFLNIRIGVKGNAYIQFGISELIKMCVVVAYFNAKSIASSGKINNDVTKFMTYIAKRQRVTLLYSGLPYTKIGMILYIKMVPGLG